MSVFHHCLFLQSNAHTQQIDLQLSVYNLKKCVSLKGSTTKITKPHHVSSNSMNDREDTKEDRPENNPIFIYVC